MANKIKPEIVAAIAAAIQQVTKDGKVVAVKIKNNQNWALASRMRK